MQSGLTRITVSEESSFDNTLFCFVPVSGTAIHGSSDCADGRPYLFHLRTSSYQVHVDVKRLCLQLVPTMKAFLQFVHRANCIRPSIHANPSNIPGEPSQSGCGSVFVHTHPSCKYPNHVSPVFDGISHYEIPQSEHMSCSFFQQSPLWHSRAVHTVVIRI